MRPFTTILKLLYLSQSMAPVSAKFTLETFKLISFTPTTQSYCTSTSPNTVLPPSILSSAVTLCNDLPSSITLAPANHLTGECTCSAWYSGAMNAVACNCDVCAPLDITGFDRTSALLTHTCMVGDEVYEGGYMLVSGMGEGRAYLAVYVDGGFERPAMGVGCTREISQGLDAASSIPVSKPSSSNTTEPETQPETPNLNLTIPPEITDIIEEIISLHPTSTNLTDIVTPPLDFATHHPAQDQFDEFYAKLKKQHDQMQKDNAEEVARYEEMKRLEAEALAHRLDEEAKELERQLAASEEAKKKALDEAQQEDMKKLKEDIKKPKEGKEKTKEEEKKERRLRLKKQKKVGAARQKEFKAATKRYGALHGLTDQQWNAQIREEKRKGLYRDDPKWVFNRPGWVFLCKVMHIRHACVTLARYDPWMPCP